ncbi:MAG: hypothetical protein ACYSSP_05120 [Planctomycetota bacterium]|jgi:hypothetical protein
MAADQDSNLAPLAVYVALLGVGSLLVSWVNWERCAMSLWCALTCRYL